MPEITKPTRSHPHMLFKTSSLSSWVSGSASLKPTTDDASYQNTLMVNCAKGSTQDSIAANHKTLTITVVSRAQKTCIYAVFMLCKPKGSIPASKK